MINSKITQEEIENVHVERQETILRGTPTENKQVFDAYPDLIASKHNGLCNEVEAIENRFFADVANASNNNVPIGGYVLDECTPDNISSLKIKYGCGLEWQHISDFRLEYEYNGATRTINLFKREQ